MVYIGISTDKILVSKSSRSVRGALRRQPIVWTISRLIKYLRQEGRSDRQPVQLRTPTGPRGADCFVYTKKLCTGIYLKNKMYKEKLESRNSVCIVCCNHPVCAETRDGTFKNGRNVGRFLLSFLLDGHQHVLFTYYPKLCACNEW